jgi:3-oxoacyl-[acyl-carrier protein] reductase
MGELTGKTALVTGAAKGIGAAIAKAMAAAGAAVAVNYATDRDGAKRVVAEINNGGGRAIAVQGDVSSAADAKRIIAEAVQAFGSLHVLVNNAAVYGMAALEDISEHDFQRHFGVNVLGPTLLTQQALKHFGAGACVINIASTIVLAPEARTALYSTSKAALIMLTEVLARELGARGIRVNTISPGVTHTDGHPVNDWSESIVQPLIKRTPLSRIGAPSDIAPAAVFLASDAAAWITGATLYVSGGFR